MGVASRRPTLPAPTDSSAVESAEESITPTDLATDVSRLTEKTSLTIPDDGRPITISTGRKRSTSGKLTKSSQHSQTSLLIEYFEAGKGPSGDLKSRPSVRVKVHPSGKRHRNKQEGEIRVTETHGDEKASHSRRISLGTDSPVQLVNRASVSSLDSEAIGHGRPPVEVEFLPRDGSDLSGASVSREARYIVPTSDISSMPADSMIESHAPVNVAGPSQPDQSRSLISEETMEQDMLKAPQRSRSRSLSHERLTGKVIEKLRNKPREVSSGSRRRTGDKSSSRRSVSKELVEGDTQSPRRRSGKHREEDSIVGAESSIASNSLLSANANRKSGDQYSFRSGTSKSSINNPKLLETVEDAIRRLILPELKELKRSGSQRHKHDQDYENSTISGSSVSREETTRHLSKHGSASRKRPDVVLNRDSKNSGELLSGGSKHRRRKAGEHETASERSSRRRESVDSTSTDGDRSHRTRSKSHRLRDAAASGMVGAALTAAALKHNDSQESFDQRERRKKRSKSRSRSASVAESEEIFNKHEVPPMPMRSEVDSEITRSSLLSSNTATTATPKIREMGEVARSSPREMQSPVTYSKELQSPIETYQTLPTATTPTRMPLDARRGLGMHHGNLSSQNLSTNQRELNDAEDDPHHGEFEDAALGAAAGGAGVLASEHYLDDDERVKAYERNLHHQHPIRRGLSPIQSVASYATTEPNRTSMMHARSGESLSSVNEEQQVRKAPSVQSVSSADSIALAKAANRPHGISLENRSEIMGQHVPVLSGQARDIDDEEFYEQQHDENDRYRDSYADSESRVESNRLTNYTDDSVDAPYLDIVTAGQQVARGWGANPEYVHTPPGVESAVASLYDPSINDAQGSQSPTRSYTGSPGKRELGTSRSINREVYSREAGSPLKQQIVHAPVGHVNQSFQQRMGAVSPPQSIARSFEEGEQSRDEAARSPMIEKLATEKQQNAESPESEITTNPSVIQGPIGGVQRANLDHWPYGATPPRSKGQLVSPSGQRRGLSAAEAALAGGAVGAGLGALSGDKAASSSYNAIGDSVSREPYMGNQAMPDSPGYKDEGYITGDNPRSPGLDTPDLKQKRPAAYGNASREEQKLNNEDPFSIKHNRHLSGMSQGLNSPIYDSATGRGLDRIQSKDIVALMDHLTVRDAQRNARDTEILVTLVRSAAEMRNSFEDMKRFIAEQDDFVMDETERQHEKTQKALGGPRPQPLGTPRFPQRTVSTEDEDMPAKRKNVFKRALQGLGAKNTNELQNIEAMLMQLLDEVEGLRSEQAGRPAAPRMHSASLNSTDNVRAPTDTGYEPEGQAGTSSTGDRSGFFSNNSSRQAADWGHGAGRRESGNRVSTVLEGDEGVEPQTSPTPKTVHQQVVSSSPLQTPSREVPQGNSMQMETPPRTQGQGFSSNENTPRFSSEGKASRRNKSLSSSFFPKISRWSKTTASSFGDHIKGNKTRPYSQASQSGEHMDEYAYDPQGDDRLRSNNSLANEQYRDQENRPPSPLIPSQVSEAPKYQAHRNSLNLQHPQPRQGPTGRYQNQLESEAQNYGEDQFSPTSQTSSQWEHQPGTMATANPNVQSRYEPGGHLSPISDNGSMRTTSSMSSMGRSGPPRPPKIRDEDPLVPQRPPKIAVSPAAARPATYADHVSAARAGSPAFDKVCALDHITFSHNV